MSIFDCMKNMTIDEMVDYLDKNWTTDNAPWISWWDEHLCNGCEPIYKDTELYDNVEFTWCEINKNCRFFSDMNSVPDNKMMIRVWLESECDA